MDEILKLIQLGMESPVSSFKFQKTVSVKGREFSVSCYSQQRAIVVYITPVAVPDPKKPVSRRGKPKTATVETTAKG